MSNDEFLKIVNRSVDLRVRGGEGDLVISARLAAKAAHDRPEEPSAWHTLAMVSADLGAHAEALYCRRRAVAAYKKVPDGQCQYVQQCVFGYATSLLLHGSWEKAWPYWEIGRLGYSWMPPEGTKYWQGETDGNLLIVCEGGYGDLFLFSRFLPALRAKLSAGCRIGLFVWPGLGAFRDWWALGVNDVYEINQPVPSGVWKYSTSIMSLPAMLGVKSLAEIPSDRMLVGTRDGTYGVGFCWRSEENQTKRRFRSLPDKDAEFIAARIGEKTEVFSLCPHGRGLAPNAKPFETPPGILDIGRMETWGETARLITTMSMVVTVDTAVAHLAGLLNIPTLLLLPLNVDWKWGLTGDTTPWYPSVKLFRNRHPLSWERDRIVAAAVDMYVGLEVAQ